jgi:hypothetical protein
MLLSKIDVPKSDTEISALYSLINLLSDVPAAKNRIGELKDAFAAATEATAAAQAEQKALKVAKTEHDAAIAAERAAHDDKMDRERRAFASERQQALDKIRYQGAETERLHAQAKIAAEAAEKIKTELAERLENVKRAAAA